MPADSASAPEQREVAVETQAIYNGTQISTEEYSGVIALQVWSTTLSSYATFCSGALVTNNTIVTASHCLSDVENRTLYARMGSQRVQITRRIRHPSYDVAVLQTAAKFRMWNWKVDRFATPQAAITYNDYVRPFWSGTNAAMDGKGLLCLGYGGANWETGPYQPTLKYGLFTADYPTPWLGWGGIPLVDLVPYGSADAEDGDSGGPCLDSINTVTGRLSVVISSDFSMGVGAGDWALWAAGTILNL